VAVADAGDLGYSRALAEESVAFAEAAGDTWGQVLPTIHLGWLALAEDRLDDAESQFLTAAEVGEGYGMYGAIALLGLGRVSLRRGKVGRARECIAAC